MNTQREGLPDAEFGELSSHVRLMGARADGMLANAVRALLTRDPMLARSVVAQDADLDRLRVHADLRCTQVLTGRSAVGDDLRQLAAFSLVVTELDQVGHITVDIAEKVLWLISGVGVTADDETRALADRVQAQLAAAVNGFADRDAGVALALRAEDEIIDQMNQAVLHGLLNIAQSHPGQTERAQALAGVCGRLERIGNLAVNIAEHTVFLAAVDPRR